MRPLRPLHLLVAATATALVLTGCATSEDPASTEESAGQTITLTDARGKKVTLDGPAKRVGGTEWNVVEYAASLGVDPVGVSDVKGFTLWDSAVTLPASTKDIGTRGEPSIDTVAGLGLDVLFVTDSLAGDATKQIEEQGTPVVVLPGGDAKDPVGAMWDNIDLVAKATGTEDEAAELKKDFEAKVAETKRAVDASSAAGRSVAFNDAYAVNGQVTIRPYGEGSLIGGVLGELGLENAWTGVSGLKFDPAYGLAQTDVEGLTRLPEDTLYWYMGNKGDPSSADVYGKDLKDNKVWTSLGFVEAGNVTRLPDQIWMFGGPASMTRLLDAVQDAVA